MMGARVGWGGQEAFEPCCFCCCRPQALLTDNTYTRVTLQVALFCELYPRLLLRRAEAAAGRKVRIAKNPPKQIRREFLSEVMMETWKGGIFDKTSALSMADLHPFRRAPGRNKEVEVLPFQGLVNHWNLPRFWTEKFSSFLNGRSCSINNRFDWPDKTRDISPPANTALYYTNNKAFNSKTFFLSTPR